MAKFEDHVKQAQSNLEFLKFILPNTPLRYDWQVTVSFYVAVHLINAHLVKSCGTSFFTHNQCKDAIAPESKIKAARFPEDQYTSYRALMNLSRRSRYLCKDGDSPSQAGSEHTYLTGSKELSKALHHLDQVMDYVGSLYGLKFEAIPVTILELKSRSMKNFNYTIPKRTPTV